MRFSQEARHQVDLLRRHYRRLNRPEATRKLASALKSVPDLVAVGRIFPAPRAYPELVTPGVDWVYARPYWIACTFGQQLVIQAVVYDKADIPNRLTPMP